MSAPDGFDLTELIGVRSPGWFRLDCERPDCDWYSEGRESVIEDAAYEHLAEAHQQQPAITKPLLFEDSLVVVPFSEPAQQAFQAWMRQPEILDSLTDALAEFGADPRRNVNMPTLERLVSEGELRRLR